MPKLIMLLPNFGRTGNAGMPAGFSAMPRSYAVELPMVSAHRVRLFTSMLLQMKEDVTSRESSLEVIVTNTMRGEVTEVLYLSLHGGRRKGN